CQSCHMPDAKGAVGAGSYPALAGNRKLQTPLFPVLIILRGQKAMPPFSDLTDEQVAGVSNYIRTNFGNSFTGEVTAEQVKGLRARALQKAVQRPG
ncbi:MAG: cytochrome c, partial [Myxococcaceae bacterium]